MNGSDNFRAIETKLTDVNNKLSKIEDALSTLAVQSEQIGCIQTQLGDLWKKYDTLIKPDGGVLPEIKNFQASCPRNSIKWMWLIVIPMGLTQVLTIVTLFTYLVKQ